MNMRFVISVVVVFVVTMLMGFVVHGLLLGAEYQKLTPQLFRAEASAQQYFPYMLLAHLVLAIGITWIYRSGRETARPWVMQGVRFGIAIALVSSIPTYLVYFAVQPTPSDLVAQQIVYDTIAMIIVGIVTAAVNRDPVAARA